MDVRFVELDTLLDRVRNQFWNADVATQEAWQGFLDDAWLYHELQLEGVAAYEADIARAIQGKEGVNYCDNVLLDQIRAFNTVREQVEREARKTPQWTPSMMGSWQQTLAQATMTEFRKTVGPTEQYKHDVGDPKEIHKSLERFANWANHNPNAHPIEVAHHTLYGLGLVWPFASWSGSCIRFAASHTLLHHGYPPLVISVQERANLYQAYHYEPGRMLELVLKCLTYTLEAQREFLEGQDGAAVRWLHPRDSA